VIPLRSNFRHIALLLALGSALTLLATRAAHAQAIEWKLVDPALQERTTGLLHRYYTIVRPDSLRLRYLRNNGNLAYRIRARIGTGDSLGQILSISLGQLTLYSPSSVRIAVGDDMYEELLRSRNNPLSEEHEVVEGDEFGHDDWDHDYRVIAAIDRIDVHIGPALGAFVAAGAPESNLSWWTDGTLRVGANSPSWEVAALIPFAAGATSVGPVRERLLAPGYGATATAHVGSFTGRARFTTIDEPAFDATRVAPAIYVHTFSGELSWARGFETTIGSFRGDVGVGYEEFTQALLVGDSARTSGHVSRLSPVAQVTWVSAQRNLQAKLGLYDLALRGSFTARLTESLWVEVRAVSNDLFRPAKPFEHPFTLFITPRIKM
jgi:hypothetical protein